MAGPVAIRGAAHERMLRRWRGIFCWAPTQTPVVQTTGVRAAEAKRRGLPTLGSSLRLPVLLAPCEAFFHRGGGSRTATERYDPDWGWAGRHADDRGTPSPARPRVGCPFLQDGSTATELHRFVWDARAPKARVLRGCPALPKGQGSRKMFEPLFWVPFCPFERAKLSQIFKFAFAP